MSMSCGIFVQFFKCKTLMSDKFVSFIASYTRTLCIAVEAAGVPSDVLVILISNNREDDDGFEYLRN
jgi:hypothetical protein